MSDLEPDPDRGAARSRSQLSVSTYFDPICTGTGWKLIFESGPALPGAQAPCPKSAVTPRRRKAKAARWCARPPGIELISNVCRHRRAVMLRGRGRTPAATSSARCTAGPTTPAAAAGRAALRRRPVPEPAQLPGAELERAAVRGTWPRRHIVPTWPARPQGRPSISAATCSTACCTTCHYNWKTFIEVYLGDYHVAPSIPGWAASSPATTCAGSSASTSVQTVARSAQGAGARQAGSPDLPAWQRRCFRLPQGQAPRRGAVWLTYYPTTMVEWYPTCWWSPRCSQRARTDAQHGRVLPRGDRRLRAQSSSRPSRPPTGRPARRTTRSANAWTPPRALMELRRRRRRAPTSPMEDGMQHFHEWYPGGDGGAAEG